MKYFCISAFLQFVLLSCFAQNDSTINLLYEKYSKAYENMDVAGLSQLFTEDATAINLYQHETPNSIKGNINIGNYYKQFFQRNSSANNKLRLLFKIAERKHNGNAIYDNGFYALEISNNENPKQSYFGKFSTVIHVVNSECKFFIDATSTAGFTEFENTDALIIPATDYYLYPDFYDKLLGTYITIDKKLLTIGRSQGRLYAYYPGTGLYRGLKKINATTWTAGEKIISDSAVATYRFIESSDGYKVEVSQQGKQPITAIRSDYYTTKKGFYKNSSGIKLGSTIFFPKKPNGKAIVLVHGSNAQDRNGYASIIRILADVLARNGTTVLTYDKQGVGSSSGNWEGESFEQLAEDALAGINYLKSNKQFKFSKIGLGGSSQAGWIIAKAVEKNPAIDFVLTIGAAGSGVSVIEQNLYNTRVLMECQNFNSAQIATALKQQNLFYAFLQHASDGKELDNFTKEISKDSLVSDWLYPVTTGIDFKNKNQWYTALEIGYDPLAAWKQYNKPALMLFSEFDDSTPTTVVIKNLEALNKKNINIKLLPKSQHIGLLTNGVCNAEIANLDKFHPNFFQVMINWINAL
ncbi:MAG: serine aminopeptidase domain-containing protein [Chitinophagaceae bacterium]